MNIIKKFYTIDVIVMLNFQSTMDGIIDGVTGLFGTAISVMKCNVLADLLKLGLNEDQISTIGSR